jgi:hypothetical protein
MRGRGRCVDHELGKDDRLVDQNRRSSRRQDLVGRPEELVVDEVRLGTGRKERSWISSFRGMRLSMRIVIASPCSENEGIVAFMRCMVVSLNGSFMASFMGCPRECL